MFANNLAYRIEAKVVYKNLEKHKIEYTQYRDYDFFKCKYADKKTTRVQADTYRRNLEYTIAIQTLKEADYMIDDQVEIGEDSYRVVAVDIEIDNRNGRKIKPLKEFTIYLQK